MAIAFNPLLELDPDVVEWDVGSSENEPRELTSAFDVEIVIFVRWHWAAFCWSRVLDEQSGVENLKFNNCL